MSLRASVLLILACCWSLPAWAGVDFDGTDDLITLPAESSFGIEGGPLTMSAWVLIDDYNATDLIGRIVGKGGTGFTAFEVRNTATLINCVSFGKDYATTDLQRITADNTLSQDAWHHILVTWDGGATATNAHIYIDGTEPSYQTTTNGVDAENSDSTAAWTIGNNTTPGVRRTDGTITEVAIWGVELTAQEIANLARSRGKRLPLQIQPSNLKAYYPMDDQPTGTSADGDTVEDITRVAGNGSGNDGVNNTGLTWLAESVLSYP